MPAFMLVVVLENGYIYLPHIRLENPLEAVLVRT